MKQRHCFFAGDALFTRNADFVRKVSEQAISAMRGNQGLYAVP